MSKILSFFGITWVRYALIGVAIGAYTFMIFSLGKTVEHVKTLEVENKYISDEAKSSKLALDKLSFNIGVLNTASENFEKYKGKINTVTKQIHTETVKELEKPVYKECVVSQDYFNFINNKFDELNGK